MRICRKKLMIALLFLGIGRAHAGILLEPYGGYAASVGALEKKLADDSELIIDYGGWDFGARAGYVYDIFMAGFDFDWRIMKPTYTLGDPDTKEIIEIKPKVQMINFGIFVGVWLKNNINARFTYFPLTRYEFTEIPSDLVEYDIVHDGDTWSGNGLSLAIGWRVHDWVAVNFEYKYYSYNKFKDEKVDSEKRFKPKELLFTVSLPFNLTD
ncbi:MAG: hypothetical protein DRQ89_10580 [Epsilonproteobacteria bacterium]|nr:MAG: hypothetical protein DRQ89_10580 [Campylobacterota bacterium]